MQSNGEGKLEENNLKKKRQKTLEFLQIGLRISALITSIAASCLAFTSKQSALLFGIQMDAKYSYSSAFKFFAYATAIASAFSLLSLGLALYVRRIESSKAIHHYWLFFMHDLVMMCLILGGCGAATAIGYVGEYGNEHAGWIPICDHFSGFCHKATASIVLGYLSFFFFFLLTVLSAATTHFLFLSHPF